MAGCPNCKADTEEGTYFCKECGFQVRPLHEEAATWRLPPNTAPGQERPTTAMPQGTASRQAEGYYPPTPYYPPAPPAPPATGPVEGRRISLGDWLHGGWQVYRENWLLMSVATVLASLLSVVTLGVLAGPLLMGLYQMAFRTMKGEAPEISDLFNWEGRFLQAFLAFLIVAAVYGGLAGAGGNNALWAVLSFVAAPFLTVLISFTLPLILDRRMDVAAAVNQVGRMIFSRDALMWWVVGLVFGTVSWLGAFACFFGVFVTVPWIISSAAVAYSDVFGLDDPNRTMA